MFFRRKDILVEKEENRLLAVGTINYNILEYELEAGKMKNLIIIIGTILLGALIVNTLVLGDNNSLKSTAEDIMEEGTSAIMNTIDFGKAGGA